MKRKRENDMLNFLCKSVANELVTPITCMAEILDQVIEDQGPESDESYSLEIVKNTT